MTIPDHEEPRRPGHKLVEMRSEGYAYCECGKRLELEEEDWELLKRTRGDVHNALMDRHRAHLASLGDQER